MVSDAEYVAKIASTFRTVDVWKVRMASPTDDRDAIVPEDEDWPPLRLSSLARNGLGAAVDHLDAIRLTVEHRRLFTFAQMTLARSALIGAANAVWLLSGETVESRVERARRMALETMRKEMAYFKRIERDARRMKAHDFASVVSHKEERIEQLRSKRTADGQRAEWNQTDVVLLAAAEVGRGDDDLRVSVLTAWHTASADSHGLMWSRVMQAAKAAMIDGAEPGARIDEIVVGGNIAEVTETYLGAFHVARRGWELLDELRAG